MALPYRNALAQASDLDGFVMEGDGAVSFPQGRLRLESTRPASDGQLANIVYWVPGTFGDRIAVEWSFLPVREPGLAILFFAARGRTGSPYRVARPGRPRVARVLEVDGPTVLQRVRSAVNISTNDAAQYGLAAIQLIALLGDPPASE